MERIRQLVRCIGERRPVYVQTHDFPDHDAIASAFGMQKLLATEGVASRIVFGGDIQRESLRRMIRDLGIETFSSSTLRIRGSDPIVIVDGCKGNRNVTELPGDEIAVIDHHEVKSPDNVPFVDIRAGLGACATIVYLYWSEAGAAIPRDVATALMIGINMDTALLTRQVSPHDIRAYADLYTRADLRLENSILRNSIQTRDLAFYIHALENVEIRDRMAFCWFPEGCNQNLLGILGDFFISVQEAELVVLCARNGGVINVSVRSEREEWNASRMVQEALRGIGFGGGHADMAGGIIPQADGMDGSLLQARFRASMGSTP